MSIDSETLWSADHASIDPTFNAIRPRGVVLQRDLPKLAGLGAWPEAMLSPLMHELTHHWCFRGTLGNVLAAINLRSCETSIFGSDNGTVLAKALGDHWTFRAVLAFLRPLCEGIALFAEFDARPGRARVVSDPVHLACLACARNPVPPERELSGSTRAVLRRIRSSPDGVTRKSNVLTHPIGDIGRSYFDGYLIVKSLYKRMSLSLPQASDPDWFLCYLRDYIFEDPGLVIALLAEPPAGEVALDVFIRRVSNRLWELLRLTRNDARRYSSHIDAPDGARDRQRAYAPGLNMAPADAKAAAVLINQLVRWITEELADKDRAMWRHAIVRLMDRRSIALIAAEEIPINVKQGFVEAAFIEPGGGLLCERIGAHDPLELDRTITGWAAVMLRLGREPFVAHAFGDDKKVLAVRVRPSGVWDDPEVRRILLDPLGIPPVLSSLITDTTKAHQLFREFGARQLGTTDVIDHARRKASELADVFIDMFSQDWECGWEYGSLANFGRGRPSEIFRNEGLWPLFAPNAMALSAYIRASATGPARSAAWVAVQAQAQIVEEKFGIRLIERVSGRVRFWI